MARLLAVASTGLLAACHVIFGVVNRSRGDRNDDGDAASDARGDAADGSTAADGSPGIDEDAPCDPRKPFGTPQLVLGINTIGGEFGATLSPDELEILFTTSRDGGPQVVHRAVRADRTLGFDPPVPLEELMTAPSPHWAVSLSADGTELYFSARPPPRDIFRAVRTAPGQPFSTPVQVSFPGWVATTWVDEPFVSARGALYFARHMGPNVDMFVARDTDGDGGRATPIALEALNTPQAAESWPVESSDGLSFFFAQGSAGGGSVIVEARRAALTDPFQVVETLTFPASMLKHPLLLTPDKCRLYLCQENAPSGSGGTDIWVAARPK